jgi:hypothetical protein
VEEVDGVHNRLELQTRFTPITSARALVYMGKSSTRKERATHARREHLHQPFLCGRPQSCVSGPNRERSLRLCQGCLTWLSWMSRLVGQADHGCCQLLATQPFRNGRTRNSNRRLQQPLMDHGPRLLHVSSNIATRPRATPQCAWKRLKLERMISNA